MNKILFYTIGTEIMPSSRARIYIYEKILKKRSIKYRIIPAINSFFCKKRIAGKRGFPLIMPLFTLNVIARLVYFLLCISFYRTIVVQKVLFPVKMLPLIKIIMKNKKKYFDMDDMIYRYHPEDRTNSESAKKLAEKFRLNMMLYDKIIVSTEYLKKDIIIRYNYKDNFFYIVNNPIDTDLFSSVKKKINEPPVIGWIGTPTNTDYLDLCADALNRLMKEGYRYRLFFSGADKGKINRMFDHEINIIFRNWKLDSERELYDSVDIGLMPLPDDEWSRTKAGYKLMLYMSMKKIGIASGVGINNDIVKHGINGFIIKSESDWYTVLKGILDKKYPIENIRNEARKRILENYSKEKTGDRLITLLINR